MWPAGFRPVRTCPSTIGWNGSGGSKRTSSRHRSTRSTRFSAPSASIRRFWPLWRQSPTATAIGYTHRVYAASAHAAGVFVACARTRGVAGSMARTFVRPAILRPARGIAQNVSAATSSDGLRARPHADWRLGDCVRHASPPALRLRPPRDAALRLEDDHEARDMRRADLRGLHDVAGTEQGFVPRARGRVRSMEGRAMREADLCRCSTCLSLDRSFPREGVQLALLATSSGGAPVDAPLPDIDAPAIPTADVSVPEGRSSKSALAAAKPETMNT